ncbi:heat-shock protein HslJ [Psychromonas marina]|uniref:Heat-shock protein HslJ n=1 Tax=Psychromonas marina TaxID=88364 RepID=A0ABQ6E0B7_9GAMM|nr:META domain-containing protein [Psychromonas marina]GLS90684.1 heat-shock protein HslJ [Psychromonas marina]
MKLTTIIVLSLSTLLFACSNNTNTTMQPIQLQDLQKEWKLTSIDNNPVQSMSSISVDEQAKATGNLACNNFFGAVELQANKLRIDKMGSTRKMCEPAVNDVEMIVSNTLSSWSEVKINNQQLTLTGAEHTLTYTLK